MAGITDIHCHILPGVDDGSRDMRESVAMLKEAARIGITEIYCTPHCRADELDLPAIAAAFKQLRPYAEKMGIVLHKGFEVHWRYLASIDLKDTRAIRRLCLGSTPYILVEFSYPQLPNNWRMMINRLQQAGTHPIIAHPERYVPIQDDIAVAQELLDAGCELQVSANFINRGRFDKRRRTAQKLLDQGVVSYLATDAHRPEDYETYRQASASLK